MLILWSVGRSFANFTRELDTVEFCIQRQSDELLLGPSRAQEQESLVLLVVRGAGISRTKRAARQRFYHGLHPPYSYIPGRKRHCPLCLFVGQIRNTSLVWITTKINTHRLSSPLIAPNTGFDGWVNVFKVVPDGILPFIQVDNRIQFL